MNCAQGTGLAMRICIGFFFAVGIALIVCGCVLQNPPKGYAPAMFVTVGSLNLLAAMAGFWGSYNKKRVLMVFIAVGGLSIVLQIAFVISLQVVFDKTVEAIAPSSTTNPDVQDKHDKVSKSLGIMRWVALGFLFIELMTLVLGVLLRWVIKDDQSYHGFDDDAVERRQLTLGTLRSDIEKGSRKADKAYDRIREKMSLKYGQFAQSASDWKSKTKMSFSTGK